MGKVLSLLIGAVVVVAGLVLLIAWWGDFLAVLKGVLPGLLILGGTIAVVAGFSEFKDTLKSKEGEKE